MHYGNHASRIMGILAFMATPICMADTSLELRAGTLGAGVAVAHAFTDTLGLRAAVNALEYSTTENYESVDYDADLELATGQLLLDWYAFSNNFRFSAGAVYNGNKLSLEGKPSPGGTFTINGTTFSSAAVDSLTGRADFRDFAPYVGVGYGRPIGQGWVFTADLGILFQGSAHTTLAAHCAAGTPAATCAQIQQAVAAEQSRLDDDFDDYEYYPVLSIGVAYVF
jgi:hypothetical protein